MLFHYIVLTIKYFVFPTYITELIGLYAVCLFNLIP